MGNAPGAWWLDVLRAPGRAERLTATATSVLYVVLGLIGVAGWLWWAYGLNHQFFTDRRSEMTVLTSTDIPVPLQLEILHLVASFYAVPVAVTVVVAWCVSSATRRGRFGLTLPVLLAAQPAITVWGFAGSPGRPDDGYDWSTLQYVLWGAAVPVVQVLLAVVALVLVRANRRSA